MSEHNHAHEESPITHSHNGEVHNHSHAHTHTHTHDQGDEPHTHSHAHTQTKAVLNRLSRAIGHLSAVRDMVEQGRDCSEVLIQLAAVRSAINRTCEVLLKDHLESCIVDAISTGDTKAMEELKHAVELLIGK